MFPRCSPCLLIVSKHWPYPLAMLAGLAAGLLLGAIVEIVIVRWFFNAPRLILTTVTIFLILPLAGGELALPSVFHVKIPPQNFASPFDFTFRINPIVFHGNDILAMVMIPTLLIGLALFFRYTNTGIAVRAISESSDRASLLGVPVKRINTVVWMMASLLATIALILRAGVVGLPIGSALGYPILVRALAAAVIGKMEKLPTIFVASLGIGVLEQAVVWHTRRGLLVDPILFVVIIGALLVQRRNAASRTEDQAMSSWQAAPRGTQHPARVGVDSRGGLGSASCTGRAWRIRARAALPPWRRSNQSGRRATDLLHRRRVGGGAQRLGWSGEPRPVRIRWASARRRVAT